MTKPTPSAKVTRHYMACQEVFRTYATLCSKHSDGVNFSALFQAIIRHPELSRITRHMGNNLSQYLEEAATSDQIKAIRRHFDEVIKAYDHDLLTTVEFPAKLPVVQVYWLGLLAYETMDFSIPFIQLAAGAVHRSTMNFLEEIQEKHQDLLDADNQHFDGLFIPVVHNRPAIPKSVNMPQLLWDAMLDRDVANAYSEKYLVRDQEESEDAPPSTRLH